MGAIDDFVAQVYGKLGATRTTSPWAKTSAAGKRLLTEHLDRTYGGVAKVTEIEGVFRVDRVDGPPWVARVNPAVRPAAVVEGDAEILRYLEQQDYPAERLAHDEPVSRLGDRSVVVTEFVAGSSPATSGPVMHEFGALLGRLHALPANSGAMTRPAGSWHGLSYAGGGRRADVESLRPLLDDAAAQVPAAHRPIYARLHAELDALDLCEDLPQALIHIDFGGPNLLQTSDGVLVPIDWAGAGRGPRVHSLNTVLYASGTRPDLVNAFVAGYREHVTLEPEELDRFAGALRAHWLILVCWGAAFAKERVEPQVAGLDRSREECEAVAELVREAFAADRTALVGWESAPAPVDTGPFQVLVDAVAGKTDDEIAEFAESFGGYGTVCGFVFSGMKDALHPEDCNVAWVLGDGMGWSVKAVDGKVSVAKRVAKRAGATVHLSPPDFLRTITSQLDWDAALADGRVKVEGDASEITKLFAGSPFTS